jgi:NTP pyrophosphatase (non-canonical NTP hydrolase)
MTLKIVIQIMMFSSKITSHTSRERIKQMDKLDPYYAMDNIQELLTITMEECGELIQQCSKLLRCRALEGDVSEETLKKLTEEVGDVLCMIELLQKFKLINWDEVEEREKVKLEKLKKYSNLKI